MKKILLTFFCFSIALSPVLVKAQTFLQADTVKATVTIGSANGINDPITIPGSAAVTLKYHVIASNFPADWLTATAFGICDYIMCRNNTAGILWNKATSYGSPDTCTYPGSVTESFSLSLDLKKATTTGCFYTTVMVEDTSLGTYSKPTTFLTCGVTPTGISSVSIAVVATLYPNPATDEVNVVYDANSDVKNIAVYNVIGKVMTVYKVTGNSANLNLENIPSGIYFVRLFNSNSNVVATRKFIKQ
jgi:hypothetical protein